MRIEPFTLAHLEALILQPHQAAWREGINPEEWAALEGWTALAGDEVLGVAGIFDMGGGRGEAWSLLGAGAGRHMSAITRAVRRGLDAAPYRFLQMHTAASFAPANRWATMLGFASRAVLPAYCDDGSDGLIWTRTR